jgi:hypothetical protein
MVRLSYVTAWALSVACTSPAIPDDGCPEDVPTIAGIVLVVIAGSSATFAVSSTSSSSPTSTVSGLIETGDHSIDLHDLPVNFHWSPDELSRPAHGLRCR